MVHKLISLTRPDVLVFPIALYLCPIHAVCKSEFIPFKSAAVTTTLILNIVNYLCALDLPNEKTNYSFSVSFLIKIVIGFAHLGKFELILTQERLTLFKIFVLRCSRIIRYCLPS